MNYYIRVLSRWAIGIILIGVALMLTPAMVLGGALEEETLHINDSGITLRDITLGDDGSVTPFIASAECQSNNIVITWDGPADSGYAWGTLGAGGAFFYSDVISGWSYTIEGTGTNTNSTSNLALARWNSPGDVGVFFPDEIIELGDFSCEYDDDIGIISGTIYEADGTTPVQVDAWVNAFNTDGPEVYNGHVNPNGTYTINASPGTYRVQASGIDRGQQFYDNAGSRASNATLITVTTGQTVSDIDFSLPLGGTLSGVLTDSSGNPLEGVHLYLDDTYITACTNSQGEYTLYNIPLDIEFTLYMGGAEQNWCNNGSTSYLYETSSITLSMVNRYPTGVNFALEQASIISGTIYEADGTTPIQVDAWVSAFNTDGEWLYGGTVNQNNGTYTIQVPAGTYLVDAGGMDRAAQFYDNAGTNYENATPITLSTGQTVTNIDFVLQPGGMISGIVTSGGQPLENVNVGLYESNIGTCTDANGEYTLYAVPLDNEFTLYVGGDKWNWCENGPTIYLSETTSITLSMANQHQTGVNFSLEEVAIISGVVYEVDGTTTIMTDAWITVLDANTLDWIDFTEVNVDGTYEIAVNPGTYRVYATAVDNALQYYNQQGINPNDANVVTAISGQVTGGIDFALPLGGTIAGTITDEQGTPLANVSMGIGDSSIGTCTNAQGEYILYDVPLDMAVTVHADGSQWNWCENGPTSYLSESTSITLSMANRYPTGVNFALTLGGSISGTVTAAEDSSHLNNIWVCAFDYNATAFNLTDPWHCAETQADGSYTISEIPPGNKRVWLFPEDRLRPFYDNSPSFNAATPVMVTGGQITIGIDFSLPLAGIISGTIYDLDGTTPLAGVTISTANGDYMECSQSDGTYRIFVPAGSHVVQASAGVCDSGVDFTTQYYDSEWNIDDATAVTISTGQTVSDIDFTKSYPPELTQIAPFGAITIGYGNPVYHWSDTDVANYELYVLRVDGTQVINPVVSSSEICDGDICEIDLTTLAEANRLTNGVYQWYVREAGGDWVGPQAFTLNAPAPGLVTLGTTTGTDNLKPIFHWTLDNSAANSTYFNLYLSTSAGTPVFDQWFSRADACGDANETTCAIQSPVELVGGTNYNLYIRSYGPGGYSVGGPFNNGYIGPETFTINPVFPEPISPSGVVNLPLGNPIYTWTDIAGTDYYYLYVGNPAGTQVIYEVVSDVGYCNGTNCQLDATTLREAYRLPNGTYTFYVRGWKDDQVTTWSSGMTFTINSTLPGLVTKISPLQDSVESDYDVTFEWQEVANASGYGLYLVDPNGVASGVLRGEVGDEVSCSAGECAWTYAIAEIDGMWTWYVNAFNSAGDGTWSGATSFTVPTAIPDVVAKVSPTQNQALTDSVVTFEWVHDTSVTQYELYLTGPSGWTSDNFLDVGTEITCATNCEAEVVLPVMGTYNWYVRGYSPAGWGEWSAGGVADGYGVVAFTVTDDLPGAIAKLAPDQGENLTELQVTFSWAHDENATYYQTYVSGPNGYVSDQILMVGSQVTCTTICENTLTLPANGAYSWYLRGYSAAGWGEWSAGGAVDGYGLLTFTVGQDLPEMIEKLTPAQSALLTDVNVTFTWQADAEASKYELYVSGPAGYVHYQPYEVGSGVTCTITCSLTHTLPANGTYTWYVRGGNDAGWGQWETVVGSGASTFTVNQPLPELIVKTAPLGNATLTTLDVTFTWQADAEATKYELYLSGPNGYVHYQPYEVGEGVTCTTTCSLTHTVPANGAYTWYVRGGNDAGWGEWENVVGTGGITFNVALPLPGTATLVSPADDAIIYQTNRPTFTWNTVNTATYYRLNVVNGMGTATFDQWLEVSTICSGATCSFQLPNPIAFGGYTWQVQTYNIAGIGALSETRSFLSLSFNLQPLMVQGEGGQITRSGAWTQQSDTNAVGQSYVQSSTTGTDTLTMNFTGTQVDVVYVAGQQYGTFVVEIDGQPMRGVDANATQTAYGQIASFSGLSEGEHTVRIVPLGGAPVAIDAIVVNGQVLATQPIETPVVIPVNPTPESPTITPEPEVIEDVQNLPEATPEVTDEP